MKIAVIGGGPGGLYFSILLKKQQPTFEISVFEQNKADDSFGFGVVFSDETLSEFLQKDQKSYDLIKNSFAYWDDLDVVLNGKSVRISGNGFCGCSRKTLLKLLQQRALEEGVNLHFETSIEPDTAVLAYDLIVAADGIGSKFRTQFSETFKTEVTLHSNRFVWMGSTKPLDAFAYFFRTTVHGAIVAHAYQYEAGKSTWILECSETTWKNAGFENLDEAQTVAVLQDLFSEELDGHGLLTNKSIWRQFPEVHNQNWHHNNIVLLGDSKATAHFSIGSGTKLAMESAIALAEAVQTHQTNLPEVYAQYEQNRRKRVEAIQHAAVVSLKWFESMDLQVKKPFEAFAMAVMTRAKKVTYENLRIRDRKFTDFVAQAFAEKNVASIDSPAFQPLKINGCTLSNRIAMSAMGQYCSENGLPNDWHFQHYTSRALQGLGLIITEATAVSAGSRIAETCTGIYNSEQQESWQKINSFIHENSDTKIWIQLAHAGRKSVIEPVGPSAIPFHENGKTPEILYESDLERITNDFVAAAERAVSSGFDGIEIQMHHGFLLGSFISPLTNLRNDDYGGSIENRMRFPIHVLKAIRTVVARDFPISVRISATDWHSKGVSKSDIQTFVSTLKENGADIINVSTGNTHAQQQVKVTPMWQVPYSDEIRNASNVKTITAGEITDIDQINTILLAEKADLIALGKPLLLNPGFVMKAAAYEGVTLNKIPKAYQRSWDSLLKTTQFERMQLERMKQALKPKSHKPQ